jgi:hypothetical protein
MKYHLHSLFVFLLVSTLSSCVVAPVTTTSSGWEGAATSAYLGGVTAGMVGTSYRAPYYRSSYYAPVRGYYGGYRHVGHGHNINGGINRVGRR